MTDTAICISPTTNLDMGNQGEVIRVDLDDRMIGLLTSGRAVRVQCPPEPENPEATDFPGLREAILSGDDPTAFPGGSQTVEPTGIDAPESLIAERGAAPDTSVPTKTSRRG
jgi:hypothetical protein